MHAGFGGIFILTVGLCASMQMRPHPGIDAARQEAAHSLADMLRDAVRDGTRTAVRQMSVEVRNDVGPVIRVKSGFEIEVLV